VTIGPPACGWDNPADENDTSIAADLLRLKDIRNTIIGHKSSAQISSEEYKSLWKDLENIFIRIKMVVCGSGESEKSIRTKLEVYRSKALEPTDEIEERYANLIQRWHDEFTTLQKKVMVELKINNVCAMSFLFIEHIKSKQHDHNNRVVAVQCCLVLFRSLVRLSCLFGNHLFKFFK
jgi:hypothetical protein